MRERKPSQRARTLVTRFEQSAGEAYWMEDQGSGRGVLRTSQARDADRLALLEYITQLEQRAAKAAGSKA